MKPDHRTAPRKKPPSVLDLGHVPLRGDEIHSRNSLIVEPRAGSARSRGAVGDLFMPGPVDPAVAPADLDPLAFAGAASLHRPIAGIGDNRQHDAAEARVEPAAHGHVGDPSQAVRCALCPRSAGRSRSMTGANGRPSIGT